jgi:uncharacterized protein YcfJ
MKKTVMTLVALATFLSAEDTSYTEYIHVSSSTPAYEDVVTRVPHQECFDRQIPVQSAYNSGYQSDPAGAVVGGIIGSVLGHQIGGGRGKDMATVGGAIIGTIVGSSSQRPTQTYGATSYQTQRSCETRYTQQSERRFVGYKNVAYYKGHKIVKYSDRQLSSIPVTVTISY